MASAPQEKSPIGFVVAAVIVFVASFLTWVQLPLVSFLGIRSTIAVTAWSGQLNLMGIQWPNWLVVFSAAGIAAMRWWKQSGAWNVSDSWPMGLVIYGLIHSALLIFFAANGGGIVGIGVLITMAALGWMLVTLMREMGTAKRIQFQEKTDAPPLI